MAGPELVWAVLANTTRLLSGAVAETHSNESKAHSTGVSDGHSVGFDHDPTRGGLFVFVALVIGALVRGINRFVPVPYTVMLLLLGGLIGAINKNSDMGALSDSISAWLTIDPHLLFYIFLPALIFGSAFSVDPHVFLWEITQMTVLATFGVVVATSLTASFTFCCMGPGLAGHWATALAFGAMLSATDPVAVVALLKELGAPKQLSLLIEGESLFNDGTAMAFFLVFLELMKGVNLSFGEMALFTLQLALGGVALGFGIGIIVAFWMGFAKWDAMTQITITFFASYITFIIAEGALHVSGVLAVVALGLVLAVSGRTSIKDHESMHHFWEMIEYIANTMVFVLAGVICVERGFLSEEITIGWADLGLLLVNYLLLNVVRYVTIFSMWPLMSCCTRWRGYALSWREITIMSWSGLRGAVGLVLALLVAEADLSASGIEFSNRTGQLFLFHMAGITALTLLVNGSTTGVLVRYLGVGAISAPVAHMFAQAVKALRGASQSKTRKLKTDEFFRNTDWTIVSEKVDEVFGELHEQSQEAQQNAVAAGEKKAVSVGGFFAFACAACRGRAAKQRRRRQNCLQRCFARTQQCGRSMCGECGSCCGQDTDIFGQGGSVGCCFCNGFCCSQLPPEDDDDDDNYDPVASDCFGQTGGCVRCVHAVLPVCCTKHCFTNDQVETGSHRPRGGSADSSGWHEGDGFRPVPTKGSPALRSTLTSHRDVPNTLELAIATGSARVHAGGHHGAGSAVPSIPTASSQLKPVSIATPSPVKNSRSEPTASAHKLPPQIPSALVHLSLPARVLEANEEDAASYASPRAGDSSALSDDDGVSSSGSDDNDDDADSTRGTDAIPASTLATAIIAGRDSPVAKAPADAKAAAMMRQPTRNGETATANRAQEGTIGGESISIRLPPDGAAATLRRDSKGRMLTEGSTPQARVVTRRTQKKADAAAKGAGNVARAASKSLHLRAVIAASRQRYLSIIKRRYLEHYEKGRIGSRAYEMLSEASAKCLDDVAQPLHEWDVINTELTNDRVRRLVWAAKCDDAVFKKVEFEYEVCAGFIHAHTNVITFLRMVVSDTSAIDRLAIEEHNMVTKAREYLEDALQEHSVTRAVQTRQAIRVLLTAVEKHAHYLHVHGEIDEKEFDKIVEATHRGWDESTLATKLEVDDVQQLKEAAFFDELPAHVIDELVHGARSQIKEYASGAVMMKENEHASGVIIIVAGLADLRQRPPPTKKATSFSTATKAGATKAGAAQASDRLSGKGTGPSSISGKGVAGVPVPVRSVTAGASSSRRARDAAGDEDDNGDKSSRGARRSSTARRNRGRRGSIEGMAPGESHLGSDGASDAGDIAMRCATDFRRTRRGRSSAAKADAILVDRRSSFAHNQHQDHGRHISVAGGRHRFGGSESNLGGVIMAAMSGRRGEMSGGGVATGGRYRRGAGSARGSQRSKDGDDTHSNGSETKADGSAAASSVHGAGGTLPGSNPSGEEEEAEDEQSPFFLDQQLRPVNSDGSAVDLENVFGRVIDTLSWGSVVGALSMLTGFRTQVTAIARTRVRAVILRQADIYTLLKSAEVPGLPFRRVKPLETALCKMGGVLVTELNKVRGFEGLTPNDLREVMAASRLLRPDALTAVKIFGDILVLTGRVLQPKDTEKAMYIATHLTSYKKGRVFGVTRSSNRRSSRKGKHSRAMTDTVAVEISKSTTLPSDTVFGMRKRAAKGVPEHEDGKAAVPDSTKSALVIPGAAAAGVAGGAKKDDGPDKPKRSGRAGDTVTGGNGNADSESDDGEQEPEAIDTNEVDDDERRAAQAETLERYRAVCHAVDPVHRPPVTVGGPSAKILHDPTAAGDDLSSGVFPAPGTPRYGAAPSQKAKPAAADGTIASGGATPLHSRSRTEGIPSLPPVSQSGPAAKPDMPLPEGAFDPEYARKQREQQRRAKPRVFMVNRERFEVALTDFNAVSSTFTFLPHNPYIFRWFGEGTRLLCIPHGLLKAKRQHVAAEAKELKRAQASKSLHAKLAHVPEVERAKIISYLQPQNKPGQQRAYAAMGGSAASLAAVAAEAANQRRQARAGGAGAGAAAAAAGVGRGKGHPRSRLSVLTEEAGIGPKGANHSKSMAAMPREARVAAMTGGGNTSATAASGRHHHNPGPRMGSLLATGHTHDSSVTHDFGGFGGVAISESGSSWTGGAPAMTPTIEAGRLDSDLGSSAFGATPRHERGYHGAGRDDDHDDGRIHVPRGDSMMWAADPRIIGIAASESGGTSSPLHSGESSPIANASAPLSRLSTAPPRDTGGILQQAATLFWKQQRGEDGSTNRPAPSEDPAPTASLARPSSIGTGLLTAAVPAPVTAHPPAAEGGTHGKWLPGNVMLAAVRSSRAKQSTDLRRAAAAGVAASSSAAHDSTPMGPSSSDVADSPARLHGRLRQMDGEDHHPHSHGLHADEDGQIVAHRSDSDLHASMPGTPIGHEAHGPVGIAWHGTDGHMHTSDDFHDGTYEVHEHMDHHTHAGIDTADSESDISRSASASDFQRGSHHSQSNLSQLDETPEGSLTDMAPRLEEAPTEAIDSPGLDLTDRLDTSHSNGSGLLGVDIANASGSSPAPLAN